MTTSETSIQLENIIDGNSMAEVLDALRDICFEKAEHLESTWQDKASAKEWSKAATVLGQARERIAKLGIPQARKAGVQ